MHAKRLCRIALYLIMNTGPGSLTLLGPDCGSWTNISRHEPRKLHQLLWSDVTSVDSASKPGDKSEPSLHILVCCGWHNIPHTSSLLVETKASSIVLCHRKPSWHLAYGTAERERPHHFETSSF